MANQVSDKGQRISPVCMYSGLMFAVPPADHWPPPPLPTRVKHKAVQKSPSMPASQVPNPPTSKSATPAANIFGVIRKNIVPRRSIEFKFRKKGGSDKGSTDSLGKEGKKGGSLGRRRSAQSTTVSSLRSTDASVEAHQLKHSQSLELRRANSCLTVQSSPATTSCLGLPRGEGSSDNGSISASSSSSNIASSLSDSPSTSSASSRGSGRKLAPKGGSALVLTVSNIPFSTDMDPTTPTQSSVDATLGSSRSKPFLNENSSASVGSSRTSLSQPPSVRARTHSRSASTPSASVSTSRCVTPLSDEEEYDDDSDDGILRFANPRAGPSSTSHHYIAESGLFQVDDDEVRGISTRRPTPPPSPLVFAHRASVEGIGGPTTVAFPDMEAFIAFQAKNRTRVARSKTVSHHPFSKFSLAGPALRRPQPFQEGVGWTGKWNKSDIQEVIQSLRELK